MEENHMVIPGKDHPAYADEDREEEDDGHREDRLYDRWVEWTEDSED